jgi:phenylacetate-CoA ligase
MVRFAFEKVRMYRDKYRSEGIDPEGIRTLDDLVRLPLITKNDLLNYWPDGLLPLGTDPTGAVVLQTSGSTGTPVSIYHDVLRSLACFALQWRIVDALGLRLRTDRIATILDVGGSSMVLEDKVMEYLPLLTNRRLVLPISMRLEEMADKLEEFRPDLLMSYAGVLRGLASLKKKDCMPGVHPRILASSAEVLDPYTRSYIEEIFQSPIFDVYGSTEGWIIAFECEHHTGMHINYDINHVEILDENGKECPPGVPGSVAITRLIGQGTPLIRYIGTGDVATMLEGECACGRTLPRLAHLEGRRVDSIRRADGRLFHAFSFTDPLRGILLNTPAFQIQQFQIVQESLDRIRILLVEGDEEPNLDASRRDLDQEICRVYGELMGPDVRIEVEHADEIPAGPRTSAPTPVVISRVH